MEERAHEMIRGAEQRVQQLQRFEQHLATASRADVLRAVAKVRGESLNDLVRGGIQEIAGVEPKPEEKTERELALIRQEREEARREREAAQQAIEQRESERMADEWQGTVVRTVRAKAADVPLLADYSDAEIAQFALRAAKQYVQRVGDAPDTDDLIAFLEEQQEMQAETWQRRIAKRKPTAAKVTEGASSRAGPESRKLEPSTPSTLSHRNASERTPGANGARQMSERERLAYAAEAIPD
jgi:hypothetical protein